MINSDPKGSGLHGKSAAEMIDYLHTRIEPNTALVYALHPEKKTYVAIPAITSRGGWAELIRSNFMLFEIYRKAAYYDENGTMVIPDQRDTPFNVKLLQAILEGQYLINARKNGKHSTDVVVKAIVEALEHANKHELDTASDVIGERFPEMEKIRKHVMHAKPRQHGDVKSTNKKQVRVSPLLKGMMKKV